MAHPGLFPPVLRSFTDRGECPPIQKRRFRSAPRWRVSSRPGPMDLPPACPRDGGTPRVQAGPRAHRVRTRPPRGRARRKPGTQRCAISVGRACDRSCASRKSQHDRGPRHRLRWEQGPDDFRTGLATDLVSSISIHTPQGPTNPAQPRLLQTERFRSG